MISHNDFRWQVTWSKDQTLKLWTIDNDIIRRCKVVQDEGTYSSRVINFPANFGGYQVQNEMAKDCGSETGNEYIEHSYWMLW